MRLGVLSPYRDCECTVSLLPVLDRSVSLGWEVRIFSLDPPARLRWSHDNLVVSRRMGYDEWLETFDPDFVLTVGLPLEDVGRRRACCLVPALGWEEDPSVVFRGRSGLLTLFRNAQLRMRDNGVAAAWLPWEPDLPSIGGLRHDPARFRALLPLAGFNIQFCDASVLSRLIEALQHKLSLHLTVSFSSSLSRGAERYLKRVQRSFAHRLRLVRSPGWWRQQLLYAEHDLVLWPAVGDRVGHVAVSSLRAGTPVLAYDHPFVAEIVRHDVNGLLVACDIKEDAWGMPYAVGNAREYLSCFYRLIDQPDLVRGLRRSVDVGREERRRCFTQSWMEIFGE